MQTYRPRRNLIPAFLAISLLSLFILGACGDNGDGSSDGSPSPSATATGPTPTIPYDRLPVGYPEGFPLYPDSTIAQTARFQNQVHVSLESDTSGEAIATFYREVINEEPWEPLVETRDDTQGVLVLRFRNTVESITGNVTITATSGTLQEGRSNIAFVFVLPEPAGSPATATPAATPTP